MKKCCFIIPYFGKLPNYFPIFLKTCKENPDFNWLLFTDDQAPYNYPNNFEVVYMNFEELQKRVKSKFDFEISLTKPYKLCDYKPAYGYIFEDYLTSYQFWGHCDIDTIMGNLGKYITDDLLNEYDKLFCLGHMILYRNSYENNRIFMRPINGRYLYKESFTNPRITVFDETFGGSNNINTIFMKYKKRVYTQDYSFNFKILPTKFIRTRLNGKTLKFEDEAYKDAIYIWDKGNAYRLYIIDNVLHKEECMYMHFQQRKMRFSSEILKKDIFQIAPNKFISVKNKEINLENFKKNRKKVISLHYLKITYKWKRHAIIKRLEKYKERGQNLHEL